MEDQANVVWKYSYWLDDRQLARLKEQMQVRGIPMHQAKQNPCEALQGEIGYAEPPTWGIICRFDAAPWYLNSQHAHKNLVASSFRLDAEYEPLLETTIEPVAFEPPEMPDADQLPNLVQNSAFRQRVPDQWGAFPAEMGEAIVQGLAKMHGTAPERFDDLLEIWTANHANLVSPRYRAGTEYDSAPYSITDSAHISSCCVELFNLFASPEKTMLVRPCIGGVIVKVLQRDQYYRVRIIKNNQDYTSEAQ